MCGGPARRRWGMGDGSRWGPRRSPPVPFPPAGSGGFGEAVDLPVTGVLEGLAPGAVAGLFHPNQLAPLAQRLLLGAKVLDGAVLGDLGPADVPLLGGGDDGGVFVGGGYPERAQVGVGDLIGAKDGGLGGHVPTSSSIFVPQLGQ